MKMIVQSWVVWLVMLLLCRCVAPTTTPRSSTAKDGCLDRCGDVVVPYPFGIDDPNCAKNESFLLNCSRNSTHAKLFLSNIIVHNISVENGTVLVGIYAAYACYDSSGLLNDVEDKFDQHLNLSNGPYTFSNTRNKLTALGCDTLAYMNDADDRFGSGCVSLCNDPVDRTITEEGSCSGFGCCQTSVPQQHKTLDITLWSPNNHSFVYNSNRCDYAFLVDPTSFNISGIDVSRYPINIPSDIPTPPVVLDWVVGEHTCEASEGPSGYSCSRNAKCSSENGRGHLCSCKPGFRGNPYLPQGCQDIDEYKEPQAYPCHGTCKNMDGNYTCRCPLGMPGDGKLGCQGIRITTILAATVAVIIIISLLGSILVVCQKRNKEKNFNKNGGKFLKHQRVRIFSEAELVKATNNYDDGQLLGQGGFGSVYKGVLEDKCEVAVKKPKDVDRNQINEEFQHELGSVSQVNHRNVVKLLGLCLETKVSLLVYEFISNGILFQHIHDKRSLILRKWKICLRIAAETALALDYLHSLADPPIIHGDVKSTNILLDDKYTAKVSDFGASVLISPGQTGIATKIQGTFGYLDPEYLMTGNLTAMSDVYSFGVVLVELFTGEDPTSTARSGEKRNIIQYFISSTENNRLFRILNFEVADDEREEMEAVAELAKRFLNSNGMKRPTMKEVADELARLKKLNENLWDQQNSQETERLLRETSYRSFDYATGEMGQPDTYTVHTAFDVEPASTSST